MDKSVLMALVLVMPVQTSGQAAEMIFSPSRVILNLTEDPAHSMAVTWRAGSRSPDAVVQFAPASPWKSFQDSVSVANAIETRLRLDNGETVYHYSALMKNLMPQTGYVYRVGNQSAWSEWNQFKTAGSKDEEFSFIWFGDPQNEIKDHCSRVFREAYKTQANAAFWLFSGDVMSEPVDSLYRELFYAAGFIFRTTPSVMAPGNHDQGYIMENGRPAVDEEGKKIRSKLASPLWRASFALPENGISGFEEINYYFDYQNVRFFMINSNDRLDEQAAWMEKLLRENPKDWTVITMHHPLYSGGKGRDNTKTRQAFQAIIDRYHVDLVLTGHDHVYLRSRKMSGDRIVPDRKKGTVYVLSVSGPKQYPATTNYAEMMAKSASLLQLFQIIRFEHNRLIYKCYTADGKLYDTFTLKKRI